MPALSQVKEQTGWFAMFGSARLSERFGLHLDAQLRTADRWEQTRNVLVRPGLTYFFTNRHQLTAGYAHITTFTNLTGIPDNTLTEHRIWQQYLYVQPIGKTMLSHRFRLEQRFAESGAGNEIFSQRLRYFARAVIPIANTDSASFKKGLFAAIQDEVFINVQNKDDLNGKLFDQNRLYLAGGYRISPKADIEAGYLNQYISGRNINTTNHVFQLALYLRL